MAILHVAAAKSLCTLFFFGLPARSHSPGHLSNRDTTFLGCLPWREGPKKPIWGWQRAFFGGNSARRSKLVAGRL